MEINGKKVLTLPQQVLQNQKDIQDLKDNATKIQLYQHTMLFALDESGTTYYIQLVIISRKKEAFTKDSLKASPLGRINPLNQRATDNNLYCYDMDVESDDLMLHEIIGDFDGDFDYNDFTNFGLYYLEMVEKSQKRRKNHC